MLRVIRSSVQGVDINDEQAEDFEAAIDAALANRDQVRETYALDEIGQKDYHLALVPYTDPNGEHRWAILDNGPTEVDWQDTDDLDEAIAAYEEWVRGATAGAMPTYDDEGNEKPLWDESDVAGIPAKDEYDGASHIESARMIDAQWAHEEFVAEEKAYQKATQRRQIAFAKLIDASGRGAQAVLAKSIDIKEPTVKAIADKGRILIGQRNEEALRAMEPGDPIRLAPHMVPSDWPHTGTLDEVKEETVVVELDNGYRQEVPLSEVSPAN